MKRKLNFSIGVLLLGGALLFNSFNTISAQSDTNNTITPVPNSPKPGTESFLLAGSGSAIYSTSKDGNSFAPLTLALMPLVKINDRLFLESGVKMEVNETTDGMEFGIEQLNLHYRINPWMSFHIGKFASPWGNVLDMFGEGFVSRFATTPIGLSDDGMAPTDEVGFGLQGGFQAGYSKMLYDLYVANGPQLITDDPSMLGHTTYDFLVDNNKNKAIGGKVGILPFSNSSLQLDVFGQTASNLGDPGTKYQNVSSNSFGADLNYYHIFSPILVRIMGQYEETKTSNISYAVSDSGSTTFNNQGNSWYVAGTIRPTGSSSKVISNLELGARYVKYSPPAGAPWGGPPETQTTINLTYYFSWDCPVNLSYDLYDNGADPSTTAFTLRAVQRF